MILSFNFKKKTFLIIPTYFLVCKFFCWVLCLYINSIFIFQLEWMVDITSKV